MDKRYRYYGCELTRDHSSKHPTYFGRSSREGRPVVLCASLYGSPGRHGRLVTESDFGRPTLAGKESVRGCPPLPGAKNTAPRGGSHGVKGTVRSIRTTAFQHARSALISARAAIFQALRAKMAARARQRDEIWAEMNLAEEECTRGCLFPRGAGRALYDQKGVVRGKAARGTDEPEQWPHKEGNTALTDTVPNRSRCQARWKYVGRAWRLPNSVWAPFVLSRRPMHFSYLSRGQH